MTKEMSDYPTNSTAKVYYNSDGEERTLYQLITEDAHWTMSHIQFIEGEYKALQARMKESEAKVKRLSDELFISKRETLWLKDTDKSYFKRLKKFKLELDDLSTLDKYMTLWLDREPKEDHCHESRMNHPFYNGKCRAFDAMTGFIDDICQKRMLREKKGEG